MSSGGGEHQFYQPSYPGNNGGGDSPQIPHADDEEGREEGVEGGVADEPPTDNARGACINNFT